MPMDSGIFSPAYKSARAAGMTTGYLVSGLIITPAILIDYLCKKKSPLNNGSNDIRTYDLLHLMAYEEIKSIVIYKDGVFSTAKPLKIAAELTGTICNALISTSVFLVVGLFEASLMVAASPIILGLAFAALICGSLYCLARSYQIGFQEQCVETINYISENVL